MVDTTPVLRAQRKGVGAIFIETSGREVPCATYLASLLDQLAADVRQLDCGTEVA